MIAIIFEVTMPDDKRPRYLQMAASLAEHLKSIDGFISVERFESLTQPGKLLSLSVWRDEAAVTAWRQLEPHRVAQEIGRNSIFSDYRLRVVQIIRDYGMYERAQAPEDSRARHDKS